MDDEDDPVDREINIHLSKTLAKSLYLLQYPVRPSFMTYDNIEVLSGKVKPDQKKLELEVSLNTRSDHYARSKGEQIALNVDGRTSESSFYHSNVMDKQILSSCAAGGGAGRYAVGCLKNGELYLSPIDASVQLKPSFEYLDKVDARQKSEADSKLAEAGDSSQDEAEDDAKPVTVKYARPESEAAKARRLGSYAYLHKKHEGEAWVPLSYHNIHTERSEYVRRRLLEGSLDEKNNEFHVGSAEYLKMLMPLLNEEQMKKPEMPNNVLSLTQLKSMPLGDQVKSLLINAKVIRFSQLMTLLPHGTDPQATIRSLQHVAVLVQGCWVVKSEILYPKDGYSPHSCISSDLLCRGRDFVMWRFTQSRCVTRKEIASVIKLPSEDVKDILEQMSRIKVNQGWEFVFQHDYDFTDRYPDVAERQRMLWDAKYQTISKQLNITEAQEKKIKEVAMAEMVAERPPRRRRTSSRSRKRTLSGRSISDHSDIEQENDIEMALKDTKENHAALNGETMEISADNGLDGLEQVPLELKTELMNFIQEKLYSRFVLSMSDLKRLFNVKLSSLPPGHILGKGVSDKLIEKTVLEVGGISLAAKFSSLPPGHILGKGVSDKLIEKTVLEVGGISLAAKWKDETVFVLAKVGDELDPLRKILLDVLCSSYKVHKRTFVKKVETESGVSPSDNDCRTVLREYYKSVKQFGSRSGRTFCQA